MNPAMRAGNLRSSSVNENRNVGPSPELRGRGEGNVGGVVRHAGPMEDGPGVHGRGAGGVGGEEGEEEEDGVLILQDSF